MNAWADAWDRFTSALTAKPEPSTAPEAASATPEPTEANSEPAKPRRTTKPKRSTPR